LIATHLCFDWGEREWFWVCPHCRGDAGSRHLRDRLRRPWGSGVNQVNQVDCEIVCVVVWRPHPIRCNGNGGTEFWDATKHGAYAAEATSVTIGTQHAEPTTIHHRPDRV
jgi:hypothetical protein